jgi:hypothetical protein
VLAHGIREVWPFLQGMAPVMQLLVMY